MRYAERHLGAAATAVIAATIPLSLTLSLVHDVADLPLRARINR